MIREYIYTHILMGQYTNDIFFLYVTVFICSNITIIFFKKVMKTTSWPVQKVNLMWVPSLLIMQGDMNKYLKVVNTIDRLIHTLQCTKIKPYGKNTSPYLFYIVAGMWKIFMFNPCNPWVETSYYTKAILS